MVPYAPWKTSNPYDGRKPSSQCWQGWTHRPSDGSEHYLLTGNRAIDQAAAERVRNLARQCQATAPATEEVQP